ncbi:hypothetical protein [Kitasatospora sp. NPDC008115]|uniref:hypothetical protein n=1 Tax=Kitasatospora sp. NPDC008115 TaxID=3364022 RepID=UPI0036E81A82
MTVQAVSFPCVLVDDDDWLIPCESPEDVRLASEPEFVSDIRDAFDAGGRPLRLFATGPKGNEVDFELAGPADPERFRRCVEAYFHHWTDAAPPVFAGDAAGYAAAVVVAARETAVRRRKRKGDAGGG